MSEKIGRAGHGEGGNTPSLPVGGGDAMRDSMWSQREMTREELIAAVAERDARIATLEEKRNALHYRMWIDAERRASMANKLGHRIAAQRRQIKRLKAQLAEKVQS